MCVPPASPPLPTPRLAVSRSSRAAGAIQVGTIDGQVIDLLVTTMSTYRAKDSARNRIKTGGKGMGNINMRSSWDEAYERYPEAGGHDCNSVDLRFSFCGFCDGSDGCDTAVCEEPITVAAVNMFFMDIDGQGTKLVEQFYVNSSQYDSLEVSVRRRPSGRPPPDPAAPTPHLHT